MMTGRSIVVLVLALAVTACRDSVMPSAASKVGGTWVASDTFGLSVTASIVDAGSGIPNGVLVASGSGAAATLSFQNTQWPSGFCALYRFAGSGLSAPSIELDCSSGGWPTLPGNGVLSATVVDTFPGPLSSVSFDVVSIRPHGDTARAIRGPLHLTRR